MSNDPAIKAIRYAELCLKQAREPLTPEEQSEKDRILQESGLSHEELTRLAGDEVQRRY